MNLRQQRRRQTTECFLQGETDAQHLFIASLQTIYLQSDRQTINGQADGEAQSRQASVRCGHEVLSIGEQGRHALTIKLDHEVLSDGTSRKDRGREDKSI